MTPTNPAPRSPSSLSGLRRLGSLAALALSALGLHAQNHAGWTLVFQDEFSGAPVSSANWNTYYWGDASWGRTNTSNQEKQLYLDNQFEFVNGTIRIRANTLSTPMMYNGQAYQYASGMLSSYRKKAYQKGYFEIRARWPQGKGFWPAFWLASDKVPITWPPEIDILEAKGEKPHQYNSGAFHTHPTSPGSGVNYYLTVFPASYATAKFNVYGLEWDDTHLTWYLNGQQMGQTYRHAEMNHPMHIMINLAVGGTFVEEPDTTTPFPSYFDLDYVRVWQRTAGSTAPIPYLAGYNLGGSGTVSEPASGQATLLANGTGFNLTSVDNFYFAAKALWDNGEVKVRIASQTAGATGQAGVMMREYAGSASVGSRHASLYLTNGQCVFIARPTPDQPAIQISSVAVGTGARWLRLVRTGHVFAASHSSDGVTWTSAGSTTVTTISGRVFGGVAASGGGVTNTVSVTDMTILE